MAGSANIVRSYIQTILSVVNSKVSHVCTAPCDGLVLKMHYQWSFFFFTGLYFVDYYSWYIRDSIICASHFDASPPAIRGDYLNICYSYPYLEIGGNGDQTDSERRYLLFYRWISWSLLAVAVCYYIPRKLSKNFDNLECKQLLENLAKNSHHYAHNEEQMVDMAARYLTFNLRTHNGLYWKFVIINIVSLIIDICAMIFLNFLLQGRFFLYGIRSFPFTRDPVQFTDYISQTFPPFAFCTLDSHTKLTNQRAEKFGCHLSMMELYEKVFMAIWVWLIILMFATACYIIFLFLMLIPAVRPYLLRVAKPVTANGSVRSIIEGVDQNCKIGDIYILYRLRGYLTHAEFYELLNKLTDLDLNMQTQPINASTPGPQEEQLDASMNIRNRHPNVIYNQQLSLNPEYLQHLAANPQLAYPMYPNQVAPYLMANPNVLVG